MRRPFKILGCLATVIALVSLSNILLAISKNPFISFMQQMLTSPFIVEYVLQQPTAPVLKQGDNVTVNSLSVAQSFMSAYSLSDLSRITLTILYDNFTRRMPLFIDDSHRKLFMSNNQNVERLEPPTASLLRGEVNVVRNGTIAMPLDCGWESSVDIVRKPRQADMSEVALCPLLVPDSDSFQHFVDGTLPKITQTYELLRRSEVKLLLFRSYSDMSEILLRALNISEDRIVWYIDDVVYRADYMIFTCVTPPLHPTLWLRMRRLLGVADKLQVPENEAVVILLTRVRSRNVGRLIINKQEVITFLRRRYGGKLVIFDGDLTLSQSMETFGKARVIVGVHGGAFYNLNFAPLTTTIIEFGPQLPNNSNLAHTMFWVMADLLGQTYWRVPYFGVNYKHDIQMDLASLKIILDIVDKNAKANL